MTTGVAVAALLAALVSPQDKVLCRADGGHVALESTLAACCVGSGARVPGAPAAALATVADDGIGCRGCRDLAVSQRSLRPHPPVSGAAPAAGRPPAIVARAPVPLPAEGAGPAQVLAAIRATVLLI